MIKEITLTKRVQTPTPPNEWCYQDQGDNFRYFTKKVILGANSEPWHECTDMAKVDYEAWWEREHPQPAGLEPEQATTADEEGGEG